MSDIYTPGRINAKVILFFIDLLSHEIIQYTTCSARYVGCVMMGIAEVNTLFSVSDQALLDFEPPSCPCPSLPITLLTIPSSHQH